MNETLAVEQTQMDDKQLAKMKLLFVVIILLVIVMILAAVVFGKDNNKNKVDDLNKENLDNTESYPESYIPDATTGMNFREELEKIVGNEESNIVTTSEDNIGFLERIELNNNVITNNAYSPGAGFITLYYSNIEQGKLLEAFNYGSQGRTFTEFESLYKNVSNIKVLSIEDKGNYKFFVRLVLAEHGLGYKKYNVELNLNKVDDYEFYIENSVSNEVEFKPRLLCRETMKGCIIFDQDFDVILWPGYIHTTPIISTKLNGNQIQLISVKNTSGFRSLNVNSYDKSTGILKHVESFSTTFFDELCTGATECDREKEACFYSIEGYSSLDAYKQEGCFKTFFQNEEWFSKNLEYLEKANKYE